MTFKELVLLTLNEAETELAATGDQTFSNGNLVDINKMPQHKAVVKEIKKVITDAGLWDKFKARNVRTMDIVTSKVHKNKVWVTADDETLYVYNIVTKKLTKGTSKDIEERNVEMKNEKENNLRAAGKIK